MSPITYVVFGVVAGFVLGVAAGMFALYLLDKERDRARRCRP